MRVIAGKFRSRTLKSLEGLETRPTYDRLKETLFNVLASAGMVAECAWADLFAGTGAVGIEALSRGAASVHFAESSSSAAQVLRQNLALAGTGGRRCGRARRGRGSAPVGQGRGAVRRLLFRPSLPAARSLRRDSAHPGARQAAAEGGIVVAEHEKRFDPGDGEGNLRRYRLLKQGESALSFYRRSAETSDAGEG